MMIPTGHGGDVRFQLLLLLNDGRRAGRWVAGGRCCARAVAPRCYDDVQCDQSPVIDDVPTAPEVTCIWGACGESSPLGVKVGDGPEPGDPSHGRQVKVAAGWVLGR